VTVRRQGSAVLSANPAVVAGAIRSVLNRGPQYMRSDEVESGAVFSTNVRPTWLLLGTDMKVELQPAAAGTEVLVETKSQFYILGDVFGFYEGYIQSFLSDVRRELRRQ
jgi:hypothetical protein